MTILGDLLTNAKKVTVSVLYWYEKLSSLLTEIFTMILKRIKNFFYDALFNYPKPVLPIVPPCSSHNSSQQQLVHYTIGYVHT